MGDYPHAPVDNCQPAPPRSQAALSILGDLGNIK